jgi:hypothetical protein
LFPKKIPKLQLITKIEISKLNNITHKYKHTPKKNIQKKNFHGERIISKLKLPHSSFPRFLSNGQSVEYCETGNQTVLKNPNKTFQLLPYNIIAYSYTAVQNYIVRRISLVHTGAGTLLRRAMLSSVETKKLPPFNRSIDSFIVSRC